MGVTCAYRAVRSTGRRRGWVTRLSDTPELRPEQPLSGVLLYPGLTMGRLRQAPSRFAAAPDRLGSAPQSEAERSRQRRIQTPWRNWYNTSRWKDLRWDVLEAALFTCTRCGRLEGDTSKLVADHIIPHRGDEGRFWDRSNLQCLCKACHDRVKQAEERRGPLG